MPIYKGNQKIVKLYIGNKQIVKRYKGTQLIYSATRLPTAYQEVEYIESTGTQYIDTGFKTVRNRKFEFDVAQTEILSGFPTVLGAMSDNIYKVVFGYGTTGGGKFYSQCGGSTGYVLCTAHDTARHKVVVVNTEVDQNITIDSESAIGTYGITSDADVNLNLFLFARNKNGTAANFSKAKLYSYKCSDLDGNVIQHLIPCYRKSDNEVGMYDLVSSQFYINRGSGTFNFKYKLPSGYTQVEYIESVGGQYIDTNFVPKGNNYTLEVDAAWTGNNLAQFETFIGFMKSTTENNPRMGIHKYNSNFMFGANTTKVTSTPPVKNERCLVKGVFISELQKLYYNGAEIDSSTTAFDFSTNESSIYIFARNCPNSMNYCAAKLYGAKIYEATTLVRDFLPCYRARDNVIGLYDLITDKFYENLGLGSFTKGSDI